VTDHITITKKGHHTSHEREIYHMRKKNGSPLRGSCWK